MNLRYHRDSGKWWMHYLKADGGGIYPVISDDGTKVSAHWNSREDFVQWVGENVHRYNLLMVKISPEVYYVELRDKEW